MVVEAKFLFPTLAQNAITFDANGEESLVVLQSVATGCAPGYQCFSAKIANTMITGDGNLRLGYSDRNAPNASIADSNTVSFTVKGVYYYLNNHLGTPAAITDSEGAVVWRAEYFPWGDVVDGTVEQVGNHSNRISLTGHYHDSEMDLDPAGDERDSSILYMRARYYDTEIGRFCSVDPVGPAPEYSYANNNPIAYADPSGKIPYLNAVANYVDPGFNIMYGGAEDFGLWLADIGIPSEYAWAETFGLQSAIGLGQSVTNCTRIGDATIGALTSDQPQDLESISQVVGLESSYVLGAIGWGGAIGSLGAAKGAVGAEAGEFNLSKTVAGEISERPYLESPLTIREIMSAGEPIPDPQGAVPGGLWWEVPGDFNGSTGTYQLLYDPETNTIMHFLFTSGE
jgi:RHS repeat-associated protein